MPSKDSPTTSVSRRDFIRTTAAGAFGATILPRHILGGPGFQAPSDTLNVAAIGAGGMGASNMNQLLSENIVAICDVNYEHVAGSVDDRPELKAAYDKAERYDDFREMLEEQQDIDAVVIATPDHVHAAAAVMAMRMGKHVYVQKPLTYTIHEARVLREVAAETGVVTQMGNQGHSHDDGRRLVEWVWAGAIGPVHEAHIWTNRPIWPQGIPAPTNGGASGDLDWNMRGVMQRLASTMGGSYSVPDHVKWDLLLGPGPYVEYHPIYHPFNWRGWTPWGTGALGDMGAHLIDHTYWALDLDYPTSVEASGTPFGGDNASFPLATLVHYDFARGGRDPIRVSWYDGGLLPPRPAVMPADAEVDQGGGAMLVGEKGVLVYDTYGHNPRMYPQELEQEYANLPQALPRIEVSHEMNWANACKGLNEPSCPFSYAGPLTETMLLGIAALRTGYGVKLFWDGRAGRFTNNEDANQYLHYEYRDGYSL